MQAIPSLPRAALAPALLLALAGTARAQVLAADNVVLPQRHAVLTSDDAQRLTIAGVAVDVDVRQQVATTTMDVDLRNGTTRVLEAEILVPVPSGAVLRGYDFQGLASEPTAQLLAAEEARGIYDAIVSRSRDPALLEFAGYQTIRSSVFPVPAGGTQRVRLVWEHLLTARGDRVDYVLPRSESPMTSWTPWTIRAHLRSQAPISTVYSPTHRVAVERVGPREVTLTLDGEAAREPGPFRLSYLLQNAGVTASLYAWPDPAVGGGYFLLLAGLPVEIDPELHESVERELVLVLDRSGSMRGDKLEQVKQAATQIVQSLKPGESFAVVDYSDQIGLFSPRPVEKTPQSTAAAVSYLQGLLAEGGTDIDRALHTAQAMDHEPGTLPLVLFLTDGLPTSGLTYEHRIRENVEQRNAHERRIYTFGVGHDVNVPLLDRIAASTRGQSTYVQPGENVRAKVEEVYGRLRGPVLSAPSLAFLDASGDLAPAAVDAVTPAVLDDLYEGDQVVVLGRYLREEPLLVELTGDYFGQPQTFRFQFDPRSASTANAFVPRLWASRRIGVLIDEVRQAGADPQLSNLQALQNDPRTAEHAQEILRLSTEHGILTEYTAFLALEGTDLSQSHAGNVLSQINLNLLNRAQRVRIGRAALNQSANNRLQISQRVLNRLNRHYDREMKEVSITRVRQVSDRSFFRRREQWVDSHLLRQQTVPEPDRIVTVGTPEYFQLRDRLVQEDRQAVLGIEGDVLLEVDGKAVLIRRAAP